MDIIYYLFAGAVLLMGLLASIAIWAPRKLPVRAAALLVAILILPWCYVVLAGLLSMPKPQSLAWFETKVEKAELLGASFAEGKTIYLWLRLEGMTEPRYFVMPWRKQTAQQLEDTIDAATKSRAGIVIFKPFQKRDGVLLGQLNIQIVPPPTAPQKLPRFPARVFNPRATDI
ncbi:MAG TPA: hypothetical protein VMX97_09505 [Hyphomicrobiaceae bacterium]|nr:hypothetical protein [Hyphomicrobiaceae bacterium]